MLAIRSTQDSTIPPSQSTEFLRKDELDLYRSPWQYIRSDPVALREMANTGDLKKKNTNPAYTRRYGIPKRGPCCYYYIILIMAGSIWRHCGEKRSHRQPDRNIYDSAHIILASAYTVRRIPQCPTQ
jgi:hypothetical protein